MKRWKRLLYYLSINVVVSACVILVVLSIWDRDRRSDGTEETIVAQHQSSSALASAATSGLEVVGEPENPQTVVVSYPATSTGAPTPLQTQAARVYTVQVDDTLGDIARRFEVDLEELIEANGIVDPDRLDVGQELIIPGAPALLPTATSAPVEIETQPPTTPTATIAQVTGSAEVEIESVVGSGDLASERVMLKRTGTGELSLAGWQLLEEDGAVFIFPQLILFEGGAVSLYTRAGQSTVVELFWGLEKPVWESGETAILLDDQGKVRATYRVP